MVRISCTKCGKDYDTSEADPIKGHKDGTILYKCPACETPNEFWVPPLPGEREIAIGEIIVANEEAEEMIDTEELKKRDARIDEMKKIITDQTERLDKLQKVVEDERARAEAASKAASVSNKPKGLLG